MSKFVGGINNEKCLQNVRGQTKIFKDDAGLGDFSIKRTRQFFSCLNKSD